MGWLMYLPCWERSDPAFYSTPRHVRGFLAKLVGTVGSHLHFARGFGLVGVLQAFHAISLDCRCHWQTRGGGSSNCVVLN